MSATDVVRVGESIRLECRDRNDVSGSLEWIKEGGVMSAGARQSGGVLTLPRCTAADAGRYRCVATGNTISYVFTDVTVHGEHYYDFQHNFLIQTFY